MTTRSSSIEIRIVPSSWVAELWRYAAVAAAYILFALIGLELALVDGHVSPIWPASGIAIGALLRWGLHLWPAVLVGAVTVNALTGMSAPAVVGSGIGNTLEAITAALLLRSAGVSKRLARPRDVLWFAMLAGGSATLVGAGIGAASLAMVGSFPWSQYPMAMLTWWLGDAMGVLLLGPAVLLFPTGLRQLPERRGLEHVFCLVLIGVAALAAFGLTRSHDQELTPLSFLMWPLMIWPALRLGPIASAIAIAVLATIAIAVTGPQLEAQNNFGDLNRELIFLQGYLATTAIATLVLAVVVLQYRQVAASLRLTQHAIDAAGDAVLWIDGAGRIAYANATMSRLMRRPVDLLLGSAFQDCIDGMQFDDWDTLVAAAGEHGQVVRQLDLLPYGGSRIPIELAATHLNYEGQDYACLILRDLSERKRLEDHLTQAQKMEAIGRLAGGIAHDFNNMLAAMHGNAELLQMQMENQGQDSRHLTNILLTCERAKELTNQLMVFSRSDRDDTQIIDLNQVVQQAVDLNRRMISESIAIENHRSPGSLLVRADPSRIQQLVMNLLLNARDAMSGGGRIILETTSVEIEEADCQIMPQARPGSYQRLRISDTGTGIHESALPRIFEPFFTTKEAGRGTGLGLAIVHGIVNRADGFVTVSSARGTGARFDIYLPQTTGPREHTTSGRMATTAIARIGAGKRALLVEDDQRVLEMVKELLERASFEVTIATNGKDGLRAVDRDPTAFDLIVTDLVMPDLGGVDMATGIRERSGTLPVLFMSGYGEDDLGPGESQATHTAFIGKPFTIQDFALTVRGLLNPRPKL